MTGKDAIKRNEAQLFHRALGEQQAIERIAGRRFGIERSNRVAMIDDEQVQSDCLKVIWQFVERQTSIDLSET